MALLDAELNRLERLERSWARNQGSLRSSAAQAEQRTSSLGSVVKQADAALARRVDTSGDAFVMEVASVRYTKRTDAAERLREVLRSHVAGAPAGVEHEAALGRLGGFAVTVAIRRGEDADTVTLRLDGVPRSGGIVLDPRELPGGTGLVARLENRLAKLEDVRSEAAAEIDRLRSEADRARASTDQPFPQQDQLDEVRARAQELAQELRGTREDSDGDADTPAGADSTTEKASVPEVTSGHILDVQAPDASPAAVARGGEERRQPASSQTSDGISAAQAADMSEAERPGAGEGMRQSESSRGSGDVPAGQPADVPVSEGAATRAGSVLRSRPGLATWRWPSPAGRRTR